MDKRGQFYLIAAVIIVIAISGLAAVVNYAYSPSEPRAIDSLSTDLKEEGPRIVDYGIYSKEDINRVLGNFASNDFAPYFLKKTDNANVIFIYGNKSNINGVRYNVASKGTIFATLGGSTDWNTAGIYSENVTVIPSSDQKSIIVTVLNKEFPFYLTDNQMFYFVMIQEKGNETYIRKND